MRWYKHVCVCACLHASNMRVGRRARTWSRITSPYPSTCVSICHSLPPSFPPPHAHCTYKHIHTHIQTHTNTNIDQFLKADDWYEDLREEKTRKNERKLVVKAEPCNTFIEVSRSESQWFISKVQVPKKRRCSSPTSSRFDIFDYACTGRIMYALPTPHLFPVPLSLNPPPSLSPYFHLALHLSSHPFILAYLTSI